MTWRRGVEGVVWMAIVVLAPIGVSAQQRPLESEDPRSIGSGRILVEAGGVYLRDQTFPVSGLRGHLTIGPSVGFRLGVGDSTEILLHHLSVQHLRIRERLPPAGPYPPSIDGDTTTDVDDLVIGAKTRIVAEREVWPAVGFHFSTKLPNAGTESGLGLDTMDFRLAVLAGKTVGPLRLAGNVGVAILGDPTTVARQNDVLVYGLSTVVSLTPRVDALAEVSGRHNTRARAVPPGTDSAGFVRGGVRIGVRSVWLDGAVVFGLHGNDATVGGTVGLTWILSTGEGS